MEFRRDALCDAVADTGSIVEIDVSGRGISAASFNVSRFASLSFVRSLITSSVTGSNCSIFLMSSMSMRMIINFSFSCLDSIVTHFSVVSIFVRVPTAIGESDLLCLS